MSIAVAKLRPITRSASRGGARPKSRSAASAVAEASTFDFWIGLAVVFLLGLGLVLVYSSSAAHAAKTYGDAEYFLTQQSIRLALGLVILFVFARLPGEWLHRNAGWIMLGALVLCVGVLIPGLGVVRGGARRWLALGAAGFQPSEVAKLAIVLLLAAVLARRQSRPAKARPSLVVPVLLAQIPVVLVLAEPDLGTALVIELIVAVMVFVAGVRMRFLALLGLTALPVCYHLIVSTPFRMRRFLAFIDPWAYRHTVGYQLSEALISIGSGGIFGLGLGEGKHGLFFLPEAHTDFIFAILAQELGLVGVLMVLGAFVLLVWRAGSIALNARDAFDRYLAIGITALIGIPAVFNTCVVTGLLPTKGLPLPLVSYGGSTLLVTLAAIGLLLRIHRDRVTGPSSEQET